MVLLPSISLKATFLTALIAVFGTTISPYLFFWQAALEVEEVKAIEEDKPLKIALSKLPNSFNESNSIRGLEWLSRTSWHFLSF